MQFTSKTEEILTLRVGNVKELFENRFAKSPKA